MTLGRVLTTALVAAATCLLSLPGRTEPITYDFVGVGAPHAGAYLQGGSGTAYTEFITGSFVFDPATDQESDVSIDLLSDSIPSAPFSGLYQETASGGTLPDEIGAEGLSIYFADNLGTSIDDIHEVVLFTGAGSFCPCEYVSEGAANLEGYAVPVGVPEPTSLAILASALAGEGVLRRRRKRAAYA